MKSGYMVQSYILDLWNLENIKYDHIHGSLEEQVEVIKVISSLLEVRDRLLEGGNHP